MSEPTYVELRAIAEAAFDGTIDTNKPEPPQGWVVYVLEKEYRAIYNAALTRAEAICREEAKGHGPDRSRVCVECAEAIKEEREG
jgi:hypothetical protein